MFKIDILWVSFKYTSLYINILHHTCLLKSYFTHLAITSCWNFFYLLRLFLIIIQLKAFFFIIQLEGFVEIFIKLLYYLIFMIYPLFPIIHFVFIVVHSIRSLFFSLLFFLF